MKNTPRRSRPRSWARLLHFIAPLLAFVLASALPSGALAAGEPPDDAGITRTPPRLSLINGEVSFWRPGDEDWSAARTNLPLAPGDELYTSSGGNLELQIGPRAFVRAGSETQIGLENQEPDFLQFRVTGGTAALDLRTLEPGHTVELDTPNAAFTVEHTGYYRIDVTEDRTIFISRRGGSAALTTAVGETSGIGPNQRVVVEGVEQPQVLAYNAPDLDAWDSWNYARTDSLLASSGTRYVAGDVYGAHDLDRYGQWQTEPTYGPVWFPNDEPADWAPYSSGIWVPDPDYGWTWVDDAPWGWAPYHYGRWVHVRNRWCWAPGPIVARPYYAPALVAFFGGGGVSVGVGIRGPDIGWIALGWGEPVLPWWGPPRFVGHPWWGGWGGPRHTTIINIHNYENIRYPRAIIGIPRDRFGRERVERGRLRNIEPQHLTPIHGRLPVPTSAFRPPTSGQVAHPRPAERNRPVVATRPPRRPPNLVPAGAAPRPAPHLVRPPSSQEMRGRRPAPAVGEPGARPEAQPPTRLRQLPPAARSRSGNPASPAERPQQQQRNPQAPAAPAPREQSQPPPVNQLHREAPQRPPAREMNRESPHRPPAPEVRREQPQPRAAEPARQAPPAAAPAPPSSDMRRPPRQAPPAAAPAPPSDVQRPPRQAPQPEVRRPAREAPPAPADAAPPPRVQRRVAPVERPPARQMQQPQQRAPQRAPAFEPQGSSPPPSRDRHSEGGPTGNRPTQKQH